MAAVGVTTSSSLTPALVSSLQQLTATLTTLVESLQSFVAAQGAAAGPGGAVAGAETLGGGGASCGCSGANAATGAGLVGQTGGAAGAPTSTQATEVEQETRRKKKAGSQATGSDREASASRASRSSTRSTYTGKPADAGIPRSNPRSVDEAIAWAKGQVDNPDKSWSRLCLSFVAHAYGYSASGVSYAIDHFTTVPEEFRHPGDRNPPPGALVYWKTGSRAGHVALYLGNGMIASNDIRRPGKIDVVPMDEIDKKWGADYVGWTEPYFPKGAK